MLYIRKSIKVDLVMENVNIMNHQKENEDFHVFLPRFPPSLLSPVSLPLPSSLVISPIRKMV